MITVGDIKKALKQCQRTHYSFYYSLHENKDDSVSIRIVSKKGKYLELSLRNELDKAFALETISEALSEAKIDLRKENIE